MNVGVVRAYLLRPVSHFVDTTAEVYREVLQEKAFFVIRAEEEGQADQRRVCDSTGILALSSLDGVRFVATRPVSVPLSGAEPAPQGPNA